MGRTRKCQNYKYSNSLLILVALVAVGCYPWYTAFSQNESVGEPSGSIGEEQSTGVEQSTTDAAAGVEADSGIGDAILGGITNGFPDLYKRRLLVRASVGETYITGFSDSEKNGWRFHPAGSLSLGYTWQRKRSEYAFHYTAAARRFDRIRGIGTAAAHNLAISQTVRLGSRTTWGFSHRFHLTPDFTDELLQEDVLQELSFVSPLPRFGTVDPFSNPNNLPMTIDSIPALDPLPDLGAASTAFVGPPDGSIPLWSFRTSHQSRIHLAHALSARTSLSLSAGYNWIRFRDDDFIGSDRVGITGSVGRMLSERTSVAFGYFGGRSEQPGGSDLTWSHGARLSLSRQLSPGLQVSLGYGPVWVRSTGQEAIRLSPVLANLLGQPTLFRDSAVSLVSWGWNGSLSFSKRWERTHFGIGYSRGVSSLNALSSISKSDSLSLSLGREIHGVAGITGSASYVRHDFIALQNVGRRFDQASARLSIHRQITSGMDFSLFGNYSKLLTSNRQGAYHGYGRFGVQLVFHFPRVLGVF